MKHISVPLAALAPALAGVAGTAEPSSKVIDAHLAVQATIRSYQVGSFFCFCLTTSSGNRELMMMIN